MKESIKYLLIYIVIQFVAVVLIIFPITIYLLSTGGDLELIKSPEIMGILMTLANLLTIGYLWGVSKIGRERSSWSIVSSKYLVLATLVVFPLIWLSSLLTTYLGLPNVMDDEMQALSSTWYGALHIAVLGPIGEELLFRGGVTKALLKRYNPWTAILISGLIFGVIHLNPAQMLGAGLSGILFAWMYYKTASLAPCIWLHVVNNTLAVVMNYYYPQVDDLEQWVDNPTLFLGITVICAMILPAIIALMNQTNVHFPWKESHRAPSE